MACLVFFSPVIFNVINERALSWKEIQSYGGLNLREPVETETGYFLPIDFDVAGDSITAAPVAHSSYYVCKRTKVRINGGYIYLSIRVGGPLFSNDHHKCKAPKLGNLNKGHYTVFYESGEQIGNFTIQ